MATDQFYSRQQVTSTAAVTVTIGFVAREFSIENLSTAATAYCQFDGDAATSSASFPLVAGATKTFRNLASTSIGIASTGTLNVDILGLS